MVFESITDRFTKDEQIEEQMMTDMGELAQELRQEGEDLEAEKKIDHDLANKIESVSEEMYQLQQEENKLNEILGEGVKMKHGAEGLEEVQEIAQKIKNDGEKIEADFREVKQEMKKQKEEGQKIETEESHITKLADKVDAEFQKHQGMLDNAEERMKEAENKLNQTIMSV